MSHAFAAGLLRLFPRFTLTPFWRGSARRNREFSLPIMLVLAAVATSLPAAGASELFRNFNTAPVENGPTAETVFTLTKPGRIDSIVTYHWNNGQGLPEDTVVTISLRAATGKVYGPFPAQGSPGQGGARNASWTATPNVELPAGDYTVLDSSPATWSQNAESGHRGFVAVSGSLLPAEEKAAPPVNPAPAPGAATPAAAGSDKSSGMVSIIVALIGLVGTISAAIIGRKSGQKSGVEEGRQHSIQKFLDVQKKQLDRAEQAAKRGDFVELRAIATAVVDNTKQWRIIQENFRALLNGRIDDLSGTLAVGKPEQLVGTILALKEGFEGKALAVETELKKSAI